MGTELPGWAEGSKEEGMSMGKEGLRAAARGTVSTVKPLLIFNCEDWVPTKISTFSEAILHYPDLDSREATDDIQYYIPQGATLFSTRLVRRTGQHHIQRSLG